MLRVKEWSGQMKLKAIEWGDYSRIGQLVLLRREEEDEGERRRDASTDRRSGGVFSCLSLEVVRGLFLAIDHMAPHTCSRRYTGVSLFLLVFVALPSSLEWWSWRRATSWGRAAALSMRSWAGGKSRETHQRALQHRALISVSGAYFILEEDEEEEFFVIVVVSDSNWMRRGIPSEN